MQLSFPKRRLMGWFVLMFFIICTLFFLTFRTQAQTTQTKTEKGGSYTAPSAGQSHAEGWLMEMDCLKEGAVAHAQAELARAQQKLEARKWEQAQAELAKASEEAQKAMRASFEGLGRDEVEKAMAYADRSILINQWQLEDRMRKAQAELEITGNGLEWVRLGVHELQKDGLIKEGETINIEWDGEIMILNGKPRSKVVSEKYKAYFRNPYIQKGSKGSSKGVI